MLPFLTSGTPPSDQAAALVRARLFQIHSRVDRRFAALFGAQWVLAMAASIWVTPRVSPGMPGDEAYFGVWIAIYVVGALSLLPIALGVTRPGLQSTRYSIAAAQILISGFFIQLTGGRLETHLHLFGSLALLSLYRDWRVFGPALGALAVNHLIRQVYWPESMFRVVDGHWLLLEVGWTVFQVASLATLCRRLDGEMLQTAEQTAQLELSEARYRAVADHSNDAICLLDPDSGELLDTNRAFRELFGAPHQPGTAGTSVAELFPVPDGTGRPVTKNYQYRHPDGLLDLTVTVTRVAYGAREALCAAIRDVTEHRRAEAALRSSEERYALAGRGAKDGLWDWDLSSGQLNVSPRWADMLGLREAVTHIDRWLTLIHDEDRQAFDETLREHLEDCGKEFEHEYRILHADGSYRWMLCRGLAVRDAQGRPTRMAGSQTDVTSRHVFEQQLQHAALHDTLTGLANRALFSKLLTQAIARARRHREYSFAVLFVDLDRFKIINDSLGHLIGDQLLKEVSWRLQALLRTEDVIARFGGDEFTILLDNMRGPEDANEVAARIQDELKTSFLFGHHEICVSASIGITLGSHEYETGEEMLRDADLAMYRAKALGKNRHETFDMGMRRTAVARLTLENDLRRALEHGELVLYYQPIVALETRAIVGFEALARWNHRDGRAITPAEFIPVAEETGLILPLGQWVLGEACRQIAAWQGRFPSPMPLFVAVNLSTRELEQPRIVEHVGAVIRETGIAPGTLHLELTERSLVDHSEAALQKIHALKALQTRLYLDDFGTGYSSLSYLHRFPLDVIKIDGSFITRMEANVKDDTLVGAIITLAKRLGMSVIAEGVEAETQIRQLLATHCDYAQGHFFAPPGNTQDVEALLRAMTETKALTRPRDIDRPAANLLPA